MMSHGFSHRESSLSHESSAWRIATDAAMTTIPLNDVSRWHMQGTLWFSCWLSSPGYLGW